MPSLDQKQKALCVATRCTTIEQFVATFHRFCDDSTFFVSTLAERPVGLETAFSIQLEDKTPVLRGLCEVVETWSTPLNRFGRPGVRLAVKRLTNESLVVFKMLQTARLEAAESAAEAAPPPAPVASGTQPPARALGAASSTPVGLPIARLALATPPAVPRNDPRVSPAPSLPKFESRPTPASGAPVVTAPSSVPDRVSLPTSPSPIARFSPPAPASTPTPPSATPIIVPRTPTLSSAGAPPPPAASAVPSATTPPLRAAPTLPSVSPPPPAITARSTPKPTPSIIVEDPPVAATIVVDVELRAPSPSAAPSPPSEPSPSFLDVPEPIAASDDLTNPVAVESRTPGSSFVLPANPLMNLTDQSLGGFVDCALYEETGNFFRAPGYEESLVDIDDVVAGPPPALSPVPAIRQGSSAPPSLSPHAFSPPPERQFAPEATPLPHLAPEFPPAPAPAPARYSHPLLPQGGAPTGPPVPAPIARASIDSTASLLAMSSPDRRRWLLIGGAAAGASLLLIVLVLIAKGGGDHPKSPPVKVASAGSPMKASPTSPPARAAVATDVSPSTTLPATPPPPPTTPAIATAVIVPEPPEDAGDPNMPPVVGSGPCRLTVASTPAGSIVRIDDQTIGPSPITFDGPCKRRRVDVKHPRYALGTKFVNLAPDKPASIQVPLARPTHAITVVTIPPGATISIAGNRAGTSPTSVKIMGFTSVTLTVEKKGYSKIVQKVYSKVDQDRIMLKLVRGK